MDSETIQKVYNNYAVFYDMVFGKILESGRASAIRSLRLGPGDKVLEVGVGTGLSLSLFPRFCHVVGIDLAEEMLKRAVKKIKGLRLSNILIERMDATRMAFADDTFDVVFAAHLITAVPDPWSVLAEIKRAFAGGIQRCPRIISLMR